MKIVIIDDEIDIGFIIAFEVKAAGHEPINFTSVLDAIEYFKENSADLVICDFQMPIKTGRDLYFWLRDHEIRVPFVILTGEPNVDISELRNNGIPHIFFKPQDLVKIPALLNELSTQQKISQA